MKNSETERDLTELIKSALDNYNEDYIPGAWENFVSNRKKRQRIIIFRIASGIAASLIIGLLGLHFINTDRSVQPEKTIVESNTIKAPVKKDTLQKFESVTPENEAEKNKVADNYQSSDNQDKSHPGKTVYTGGSNRIINKQEELNNTAHFQTPEGKDSSESSKITVPSSTDTMKNSLAKSGFAVDSIKDRSKMNQSKKPSFDEQVYPQQIAGNQPQADEKRKVRFGINFSPGFNSTQAGSSFNYSGGVNTDIALFSNFHLSTGLQIEHQTVVNGGNNVQGQTKADLVNLDIPMNITWKFFSDKSKSFYVSGGVSSLAYLSEKYDKTVFKSQIAEVRTVAGGIESLAYQVDNVETTTQTTEPSFNSFDIAGRVNILFGMEQRLTPKLSLHLEPYIKIPVSGLATENLRFSTGGITCKISF